jgi:hypothetical protein
VLEVVVLLEDNVSVGFVAIVKGFLLGIPTVVRWEVRLKPTRCTMAVVVVEEEGDELAM